jgi:membrane protein implicated in regulation of membrane protease activity
MRTLVYFALGFGPVGWFAFSQYSSAGTTLLWSLPTGALVAIGTRALRSFMKKELSSTITKTDLLMEKGEVTVSITEGGTGRVRVTFGGVYVDRYAKSTDRSISIPVGSPVRVVDADDEYVYVESETLLEEQ